MASSLPRLKRIKIGRSNRPLIWRSIFQKYPFIDIAYRNFAEKRDRAFLQRVCMRPFQARDSNNDVGIKNKTHALRRVSVPCNAGGSNIEYDRTWLAPYRCEGTVKDSHFLPNSLLPTFLHTWKVLSIVYARCYRSRLLQARTHALSFMNLLKLLIFKRNKRNDYRYHSPPKRMVQIWSEDMDDE